MQVKSIAECSLQYFRPSLSYQFLLGPYFSFCGRFTQVLLDNYLCCIVTGHSLLFEIFPVLSTYLTISFDIIVNKAINSHVLLAQTMLMHGFLTFKT